MSKSRKSPPRTWIQKEKEIEKKDHVQTIGAHQIVYITSQVAHRTESARTPTICLWVARCTGPPLQMNKQSLGIIFYNSLYCEHELSASWRGAWFGNALDRSGNHQKRKPPNQVAETGLQDLDRCPWFLYTFLFFVPTSTITLGAINRPSLVLS